MAREIEPKLQIPESPFILPDAFAARVNTAIIFDNIEKNLFIVSDKLIDAQKDFDQIIDDIENIETNKKFQANGIIKMVERIRVICIKNK